MTAHDHAILPAAEQPRWVHDHLIDITEIRRIFKLGRTAAYELTHRAEFPDPVAVSPRCYRWWASEVAAFITILREESGRTGTSRPRRRPCQPDPAPTPRRITGKIRAARIRKESS